ncbi:hypothetical protein LX36DRAFT_663936 [Colletotrichum falcatum]|nr:hypothetical protein LX36DRAFT_663936 [Colletotrichum falcatum]
MAGPRIGDVAARKAQCGLEDEDCRHRRAHTCPLFDDAARIRRVMPRLVNWLIQRSHV